MKFRPFLIVLLVGIMTLPGVPAPTQEAPPPAPGPEVPTFATATSAVTLDIVVRDKKGRAVRDLKASDFEVYEDGVRQRVESFEVYGRPLEDAPKGPVPGAPEPAATAAPATPAEGPEVPARAGDSVTEARPQVIAFVFDRMAPDARRIAQKAALTYVDKGRVEGDQVAVFAIDLALRTLQPFTSDAGLIRAGLERAASQANTAYAGDRAQTRQLIDQALVSGLVTDTSGGNPGQGGSAGDIGSQAASAALALNFSNLQVGMLRSFEALERDQQGFASTNSLMAVVSGLQILPGRKTVVFFSEGLAIPSNVLATFRALIHTANRAGVSVYAMDAAGLRVDSNYQETRKEMLQAQAQRLRQMESGRDDATGGSLTAAFERNEDLLRLNPESGLGQLADETGGFLIHDTNDAASAFRRIEEDMRFHYLVGYSPSNENYDGKFRRISVKVVRPGVHLQTREGYLAIRTRESIPQRAFEAPALAQLDRKQKPKDFLIETVALSFPTPERPGLVPVLVRVPGNTLTYVVDKEDKSGKQMHRADFSVVVRVRDEKGQEVDRLSQQYLLSAPAASVDAARRGDILFYREADLAPGRHTLEAVGYDAFGNKASVGTAVLEVQPVQEGRPRLSSIVLVGRAEKVPAGEQPGTNPLYYGETLLYPSMGGPFRKSASPALGFFFTVYGVQSGGATPRATIEVFRDEKSTGQVTAELPAADASGRIQYAGALPLQGFPAGAYRLKVTALAGSGFDSRQAVFTVAE